MNKLTEKECELIMVEVKNMLEEIKTEVHKMLQEFKNDVIKDLDRLEFNMATKEDLRRLKREMREYGRDKQQVAFCGERYVHGGIEGFERDESPIFLYEKPYP